MQFMWRNRRTELGEMLVHDAADPPRTSPARVKLPARVPYGCHGKPGRSAASGTWHRRAAAIRVSIDERPSRNTEERS
nr:carotenoid oxygenase family protein [Halopolyspora algeriensis]